MERISPERRKNILHILRNPYSHDNEEIRQACFDAADDIENLVESVNPEKQAYVDAIGQLIELQNHYAKLLNMYDGGERIAFVSAKEWMDRLKELRARELKAK